MTAYPLIISFTEQLNHLMVWQHDIGRRTVHKKVCRQVMRNLQIFNTRPYNVTIKVHQMTDECYLKRILHLLLSEIPKNILRDYQLGLSGTRRHIMIFWEIQQSLGRVQRRAKIDTRGLLSHSEPLLWQLHWLPVHSRIRFKLATITFKALCTNSPQYLASHIRYHQSVRSLRSSDQHVLVPAPSSTNFGSRSFHSAAPVILELDTPRNPYFSRHRHLQTQPKNTLLLLPSCLGHLLPVHQIHSWRFAR